MLRVSLSKEEHGILKKDIKAMEKELKRLIGIYGVDISELRVFKGVEVDINKGYAAGYYADCKSICICPLSYKSWIDESKVMDRRKQIKEKAEKRKKLGFYVYVWDLISDIASAELMMRHEYCHAITDIYSEILDDKRIKELYESASIMDVGIYAKSCMDEFIAVNFQESFYADCTDISKEIREIVDGYVLN